MSQFSNTFCRTPQFFSIAVCAVDFEFVCAVDFEFVCAFDFEYEYISCAIVSAGIVPNGITPSKSCRQLRNLAYNFN